MTDITLETGQTAQFKDGIMQVQPKSAPHHYKLTAQHARGGLLDVRAATYDQVIAFLKQIEPLGYAMRNIVREG